VDGHQLARQGKAGAALSIAAIGSFLAGVAAVVAVVFLTPVLSAFALRFNAPEYFLIAAFGIIATASMGTSSAVKSLLVAVIGLGIALIGTDPLLGTARLTFGSIELLEGIDFLPVAIGLFGIAEVLVSIESREELAPMKTRLRDLWLSSADWAACRMAVLRGGLVGFLTGLMPGAGPTVAALLAYVVEKRYSKHPERFGRGALDGLAASESANNSAVHAALIPMLALGIPGSAATAVLLAGLILLGVRPGPMLMTEQPDLVWGLIASMFIGNVMLLVLNLPLAPLFASLLRIRYDYLAPGILVLSLVGAFGTTLSLFTVGVALLFGMIGYAMIKLDLPRPPLVLALVLAPLMETSLRQSLMLSRGSLSIFIERPLSAVLVVAVFGMLALPIIRAIRARRRRATVPQV